MSENSTLTAKQIRAVAAILSSRDITSAAKQAKVSERTLYRWLDDATFQAELKRVQAGIIENVVRRLSVLSAKALQTLEDEMPLGKQRIKAAEIILGRLLEFKELSEFEKRLERLENETQKTN